MGRKIFVSYKYSDSQVQDLDIYELVDFFGTKQKRKVVTTSRHYVDKLAEVLENDDNIYKGEDDGESLESLADSTISSKLGDKIFDSSITIVLISKGMKNLFQAENKQWISWEISYSIREQSRQSRSSKTNGIIAVVLPDESGSYSYYITYDEECKCINYNTSFLFQILRDNMFNQKDPNIRVCNGKWVYLGDYSYIQSVKWNDFLNNPTIFIEKAIELRKRKDEFEITKNIKS